MTTKRDLSPPLVLWDLDGTLGVRSTPSGDIHRLAVERAVGPCPVSPEPGQGMTDSEIVRWLLVANGFPSSSEILSSCLDRLDALSLEPHRANAYRPLPCVPDALSDLAHEGWIHGILTGNTASRTNSKLSKIDSAQAIAWQWVFHDNLHFSREALAAEAAQQLRKEAFETVIVVGDTPRDVAVAHSQRWLVIAVETGAFTRSDLIAAGADHVVVGVCEVPGVLRALV